MTEYHGACHCGAIKFSFEGDEIVNGIRCNCSLCVRKGALMTSYIIPESDLKVEADGDTIGLYQFGAETAHHYFCKSCGIYTHHETARKAGHYRFNLGCVEDVESLVLDTEVFDGKHLL